MTRIEDGIDTPTGLGCALEANQAIRGVPLAVEFTFQAPTSSEQSPNPPLSLGLAIDRSGSMAGAKLGAARHAATGVLDALKDGEQFAATAFDSSVTDVCPSTPVNARVRRELRPRLGAIEPGGSTALFDGYARAAELVALGTDPREQDSWVVVLSDGMGNHGLQDPAQMRHHARAIAHRGIRTISIGIGQDYQAAQLTALSDGGSGAFHHASQPQEIVEIVLGELNALRQVTVRDLHLDVTAHSAHRFSLLGGDVVDEGTTGQARFARVGSGRRVQVVALIWPRLPRGVATLDVAARWEDAEQGARATTLRVNTHDGPVARNRELAQRAARLWHARILATALEMNERGDYDAAASYVRRWEQRFLRYVAGLEGMEELVDSLSAVGSRVRSSWGTVGHKEVYVMARKAMSFDDEMRPSAPASVRDAMELDADR